jgi:pimeloyl-ACP methyl ester carboxylesterase
VAIERGGTQHAQDDFTMPKLYYGVTALIHFEKRQAEISYEDPLATERVTVVGHSFPLAADFTAPIAMLLAQQNPRRLEISGLLHPDDQAGSTRIVRSRPYDPDKTVVLIIHGLKDSPATWVPMLNRLQADEELRRKYQVWFYSYPSGYPYPHSAAILRREFDAIERRFPLRKKMVVIGHSMGGCIARLLITDTGDKLWREIFKTPPAETPLPAGSKAQLREDLIFQHRPEIGRVVFIAAPLRGSELARTWVGRVGSSLVKLPSTMVNTGTEAVRAISFHRDELRMDRAPNSVDFLTPNNRFVRAIQTIPVTPGIPHHVICGDRGKGGHRDKTKPVMTDGVVPYWSSHMDTAESELVVPSGHSAHQNAQAIAEVERILKLQADR